MVIVYLLFKIGFKGGQSILSESLSHIAVTSLIAVSVSVLWTLFLLYVLRRWSSFERLTQISIATHFGSVSVGTFIAALEFLAALGVEVTSSVVLWLAVMELPALFVGVFALKIKFSNMLRILKNDVLMWILFGAIVLGILERGLVPEQLDTFFFSTVFLPLLAYFLFEMGAKAATSLDGMRGKYRSLLVFGIGIPLLGGIFGASLGALFDYSVGEMFVFSILMASASYVLVPISLKEILKKATDATPLLAQNAIATSVALSVGITLPFNILIGFEIYYWYIQFLSSL